MGRSVLLIVNRLKPAAVGALPEVRSLIERHGRVIEVLDADQAVLPGSAAKADLVVVMGGDGTLMGQSRRCAALHRPLLGVNLGKVGFMAEFDLPGLREQAASLFSSQPLSLLLRPLLAVSVMPGDGARARVESLCLNDAVVTAGPPFRMITLSISIDGQPGPTVNGDGLIVATPLGSTAYNVSAGGPIVSPEVDAMVVTPIAAHSLSFRPFVVSGSSEVELTLHRVNSQPAAAPSGDGEPITGTALVLDGLPETTLREGERVLVRKHADPIRFVRNPHGSYWSTLLGKMRWAAQPAGAGGGDSGHSEKAS